MANDDSRKNIPKIAASVMTALPSLVFKTGWAYLRMKKRARKSSKNFERQLVTDGIPLEFAEKLAEQYASELSIRRIIGGSDVFPFGNAWRPQ